MPQPNFGPMSSSITQDTCKMIVDALPEAALVVNAHNIIIAANQQADDLLDAPLSGEPAGFFLRSPAVLRGISETRNNQTVSESDFEMRDRVTRAINVHLSALGRDDAGPLVLALLRDRTREEQIERMRSDFVANASHELRTPLTTLSGFIETMQGAASKDEKARTQFLALMKTQADRMSRLIDDLLSLSRIELDEHIVPNQQVNLVNTINQVQNLLQTQIRASGSTLDVQLPDELLVRGDANQLAQVLHNLIENAVKYSGQGKRITVTGQVSRGLVTVTVKDDGPGIASHHIPRLTERFYRVNVQDSRTRGGTGLGLAICKHILNRHRGELRIESQVGVGSEFSIHMPVSR